MKLIPENFSSGQKKAGAFLIAAAGASGLFALYWKFEQPYAGFGWKEALAFQAFSYATVIGICLFLLLVFNATHERMLRTLVSVSSVFAALMIVEIIFRIAGVKQAYIETRGGNRYTSAFIKRDNNICRTYGPGTFTYIESAEYKFPRHHNNYGFSDDDFFPKRDSNKILIQTYGDSYTEGDGAPFDSSYPAILRTLLPDTNIIIQNFGICGSDPGFYYMQLKTIGLTMKPDVAVITYDPGDLTVDFLTRGGLERFKENYWQAAGAPSWEWLYACSYVFRLFAASLFDISLNDFFFSDEARKERLEMLEPGWNQTFLNIAELAQQNKIKVLLVKRPGRGDIELNRYGYDFAFFEKMADSLSVFKRIDLLAYYRDSAQIDKSNYAKFYWSKDGHHNSAGYYAMAKGINAGLKKCYPELFTSSSR